MNDSEVEVKIVGCIFCGEEPISKGDYAILTLDFESVPGLPETIKGVVEETRNATVNGKPGTVLRISYLASDLNGALTALRACDVLDVACQTCCEQLDERVTALENVVCEDETCVEPLTECDGTILQRTYDFGDGDVQVIRLEGHPDCVAVEDDAPTVVQQFCAGTVRVTEYSDGNVEEDPASLACEIPAEGVQCAGTLTINIEPNKKYFFRNASGAVTFDDLLTPGSADYNIFKGSGTDLVVRSYNVDPRSPAVPPDIDGDADLVFPQEAGVLSFPEEWTPTNAALPITGASVIHEFFQICSETKSGTFTVPTGVEYYGESDAVASPGDPLTYASLPWNVSPEDVPAEATCS